MTLEPYSKPSLNILSKSILLYNLEVQIIQEYKTYTDKIEHEIRKIDYIVQIKKNNIQK